MTESWSDDELRARHRESLRRFYRLIAEAAPGASLLDLDGVQAVIAPSVPERSVFNGVVFSDPDSLVRRLPELAHAYEAASVEAWTVWVPEADRRVTAVLQDAGHHLDATPADMGASLDELELAAADELDLDPRPRWEDVAELNDAAYSTADAFRRGLAQGPGGAHLYVARVDGVPASCVVAADTASDCGIYLVATRDDARGRGLCSALMRVALRAGRDRGCQTTTLEATKAGEPLYRRLGYRDLGVLEMWERRLNR